MQEKRFKGLSFKKKFMLLLLGMTGAVVFLEILLQSGAFLARLNASFAVKKPDNQSCRVLCLGDSFTYGIGAQKKYSYPAQLQKLLDEKSGPGRFTVINSGEPGINTPMLCDKLQRLLDEFEPDIVLLMVGVNDSWNLEGMLLNQRMSLEDFFCWSRAYKFIKIAVFNIQRVNFLKEAKPDEGGWSSQHNKAEKVFGNTGFLFNNYFHAIMLANYARNESNFNLAKRYYSLFIEKHPLNYIAYLEMARCCRDQLNLCGNDLAVYKKEYDLLRKALTLGAEKKEILDELIDLANSLKKYNCYVETLTVLSYALELSAGDEQVFNLIDDVFIRMADAEKHGIFIFICLINFLIKQKFIYV